MIRDVITWLAGSLENEAGVLSVDEFRVLLDSERMRVDRSGGSLALLVLHLHKLSDSKSHRGRLVLQSLVGILKGRLRGSDHIGMLDDQQLGIILTETGREGAEKVISDLAAAAPNVDLAECIEVFVYPIDPPNNTRKNNRNRDGREDSHYQQRRAPVESTPDPRPLQVLFVTPLPLWKRTIDMAGALLGLVLAAPIILLAAIIVKLTSPGPAFFGQRRTGLGGKEFTIFKLRSMYIDAEKRREELLHLNEQDGAAFKIKDDPRITPFGRFLRKSCIDELPQLWNVLMGDMSLVGPRPLPCKEVESCEDWERRRLEVTPGLTCSWQVLRHRCSFRDWMRMDIRYMRARSFYQDIKLMFQTFVKVFVYRTST